MPIRFRCHHCNQLMGIARRKAGTMVQCPTCRAELVVPQPDSEDKPPPNPQPPNPQPLGRVPAPLFERSEFEDFLKDPVKHKPAAAAPPQPSPFAAEIPPSPLFSAAHGSARAHPPGLVLSPTQATWLTVAVILMVALAFGAGLLIGYYLLGR
jgi:hypothetical protein